MSSKTRLSVIGAGTMGSGIAIAAASVGKLHTQVICENEKAAMMCHSYISGWMQKEVEKNRMTEKTRYEMLSRLSYSMDIVDVRTADFVIDATHEDIENKR